MKKDYYTLDEAAEMLGDCKPSDLVYLGANDKLSIYVLAKGWMVDYTVRSDEDDFTSELLEPDTFWASATKFRQTELCEAVQLHTSTLSRLEANTEATTRYFFSHGPDVGLGITEYRVSENANGLPQAEIALKDCSLVVMSPDFQRLKESATDEKDSPEPLGNVERDNLLKKIGILATLLSHKGGKYIKGEKPNANAIADEIGLLLDTTAKDKQTLIFPNQNGLSSSSIRTSIKDGITLLTKEK